MLRECVMNGGCMPSKFMALSESRTLNLPRSMKQLRARIFPQVGPKLLHYRATCSFLGNM